MTRITLATVTALIALVGCEGSVGITPSNGGGGSGDGVSLRRRADAGGTDAAPGGGPADAPSARPDAYSPGAPPDAWTPPPVDAGRDAPSGGGGALTITLYGTASCGYCTQAKTYMSGRSIPYTEVRTDMGDGVMRGFADVQSCNGQSRLSTPTLVLRNGTRCEVMFGWGAAAFQNYYDMMR